MIVCLNLVVGNGKAMPEFTEREAAKKVLALVVKLHLNGVQPWPRRKRVREITGVPLEMLDAVLTQLHATGQISIWTATTMGNLRPEENGVQKFIQPSREVLNSATS